MSQTMNNPVVFERCRRWNRCPGDVDYYISRVVAHTTWDLGEGLFIFHNGSEKAKHFD